MSDAVAVCPKPVLNNKSIASVDDIAEWLIYTAYHDGNPLTQLKLHKVMFFAQGFHLALKDMPLFQRDFQAWKFGPVLKTIYDKYKHNGMDELIPLSDAPPPNISDSDTEAILLKVYELFGRMGSTKLVNLTHDPNGPWKRHYHSDYIINDEIIPKDEIKEYFKKLMKQK